MGRLTAAIETEPRLVEANSVPVIYADGPAMVEVEGSNARITFFEYRTLGAERVRLPVLEMIRPVTSCRAGEVMEMIMDALARSRSNSTH